MRTCILAVLALSITACDKLTATTQAVSLVTQTPDLATAQGMNPTLASALPLAALESGVTAALVGVTEREDVALDSAINPALGATVSLSWGSNTVSLCASNDAQGTYASSTVTDDPCPNPSLAYQQGETYSTTVNLNGEDYTMEVQAPSALTTSQLTFNPNFTPASPAVGPNIQTHPSNQALQVSWSNVGDDYVFASIFRANYSGTASDFFNPNSYTADAQNPIYDSFPREAEQMVQLVLGSAPSSVTIPATTFNQRGAYLLLLTTTAFNDNTSGNLSLGSAALAGDSLAYVFWVD